MIIIRNDTETEQFTFVLIPARDPYAVEALIVYASCVSQENKALAIHLLNTVKPFLKNENLRFLHKVASSLLALSGQQIDEVGN